MSISGENDFNRESNKASSPEFRKKEAKLYRRTVKVSLGVLMLIGICCIFLPVAYMMQESTLSTSASSTRSSSFSSSANSEPSSSEDTSTSVPASTRNRTPLSLSLAKGSQYYTDEDGTHINWPLRLEQAMTNFHEKTGVKPYIYFLSENSPIGSSTNELVQKGIQLYDELFDDEAHLLILCHPKGSQFIYQPFVGREAFTVMDKEACNIFVAYMTMNDTSSNTLEDAFSDSLKQTAERIMSEVPEPSTPVESSSSDAPISPVVLVAMIALSVGVILVVVAIARLATLHRQARRKAEQEKAERMERILCAPIEQLDDMIMEEQQKRGDCSASDEVGSAEAARMQEQKHRWTTILIVSAALVIIGVLLLLLPYNEESESADVADSVPDTISASTVERTPLPVETTEGVEYFTDEQGHFFRDSQKLEEGLSEFYSKTGVRPYIYILPKNVINPSDEFDFMVDQKRSEVLNDDEPCIFLACSVNPYEVGIRFSCNNLARQVIDDEAWTIFEEYLTFYSDDNTKIDEDVLSKTFVQTADRIMSKPANSEADPVQASPATVIIVGCIAGVFVVTTIILVVRNHRWAQRNTERKRVERARRLLKKASLERFEDSGLEELEEKYQKIPTPKAAAKKTPKKTPRWANGPTSNRKTLRHLQQQLLGTLKKADHKQQEEDSDNGIAD